MFISTSNGRKYIGNYTSKQEAIRAKELAEKHHGETPKIDSKASRSQRVINIGYGAKIEHQGV